MEVSFELIILCFDRVVSFGGIVIDFFCVGAFLLEWGEQIFELTIQLLVIDGLAAKWTSIDMCGLELGAQAFQHIVHTAAHHCVAPEGRFILLFGQIHCLT